MMYLVEPMFLYILLDFQIYTLFVRENSRTR